MRQSGLLMIAAARSVTYIAKYQGLRASGETVIIDGLCASACTMFSAPFLTTGSA